MDPSSLRGFLRESPKEVLSIQNRPLADEYDLDMKPFARGKFANVRRCRHRASGRELAAKCMRKRRRVDVKHEIVHEALVLSSSAKCPRIVSLHDVYETPTEMFLLMEMVPGGELQRVIDDEEHISEEEAARLMRQILEAVVHLHDKNIAHLDLKPQNVLLTGGFPGCNLKLCDFGISRLIEAGVEIREINGTPDYVAPEVLQYEPIGLSTDIWSVGVLAYVLMSGHTPFGGDSKQETFCNITEGHLDFPPYLFKHISQPAKDFVRSLLKMNPKERPSARECLEHPWLSQDRDLLRGDVSLLVSPTVEQNEQQRVVQNGASPVLSLVLSEAVQEESAPDVQSLTAPLTPLEAVRGKAVLKEDSRRERIVPILVESDPCSAGRSKDPVTSGGRSKDSLTSTINKAMSEMESMVSELKEGLAMTKRLMFTDEIIQVDERMGVVY